VVFCADRLFFQFQGSKEVKAGFSSFKISPLGDRFNGYVTHFGISSEKLAIIKSEDGVDLFALIN
jgi:hypothetical protein